MGSEFTFYDYIDINGDNVINAWLNGDGKQVKAYFNRMIGYLEGSPPASSQDSVWRAPYTWPLHDEWKDFIEIRKEVKGVQYRLIGKIEGRDVLLVTWAFHKGVWKTDITPRTAGERVVQVNNNPGKYRREHDNS